MFPTKDELIGAYLQRRADRIYALIDADIARHAANPSAALHALFRAVSRDVFRGCAFNNASIEFTDPDHPARVVARAYREGLLARLLKLSSACTRTRRTSVPAGPHGAAPRSRGA